MPTSVFDADFEEILQQVPASVLLLDGKDRVAWHNRAYLAITGKAKSQVGTALAEVPGASAPALRVAIQAAREQGASTTLRSLRGVRAGGGRPQHLDVEVRPLSSTGSHSPYVLLWLTDVTERVEEHARAQLFYQSFLTSSNPSEVTDRNGILVDVNPAFEKVYGYAREECIGRKPNLVRSKKTSTETFQRLWQDLLDPKKGSWSQEIVNRDRWGRERPVFLTITAIQNERGETTHYLGVAVDLTEKKAWEQTAAHTERLASLGRLAAGVAHEINTPLANVMLVAESLLRKSQDPWVRTRAETIRGQVDVAAQIVRGLLDFARHAEPQRAPVDLVAVTREAVTFLEGKQSADVEVKTRLPKEKVPVLGDRGQILQVLTNVLNNAYEAMEGKGTLWIEVGSSREKGIVTVTDSGPGIPSDVLPRIFDPFFTTKAEGQGTGLGLAICHGIMQVHHGSIEAENAPEGGARFRLVFPLLATSPDAAANLVPGAPEVNSP
jgi:PAS domain S-box-containing protein